MSGIEIVGLVLGAFPIILNGLESYRKGFETLEEWWQFRTHFIAFIDDVRHQMMKYNENMIRLLDPIIVCTDNDKLANLLMISNENHSTFNLGKVLEGRLASELDRFLRIVHRMHELVLALNKLLQIEDGKASFVSPLQTTRARLLTLDQIFWLDTDQQRPWQWQLRRLQISFSKGKHRKVKKLAEHNKELEDILGYSERIIPISDKRKTPEPVTHLENLRKHAFAIHRTLSKQWRCQRSGHVHSAHLSLRAEEAVISSNVIFKTETLPQPRDTGCTQEVVIRPNDILYPPSLIDVSNVHQADQITTVQNRMIHQESVSRAQPGLRNRFLKRLHARMSAVRLPSVRHRASPSGPVKNKAEVGVITSKTSSTASTSSTIFERIEKASEKSAPLGEIAQVEHATSLIREKATAPGPIDDLCAFLTERNRAAGTLDDDDSHRTFTFSKVSDEQKKQVTGKSRPYSFCELLDAHYQMKINISRQGRFEIAKHIASALLQTHLSPWLSPKWTKNDFFFFVDMESYSISTIYPSVCREFPTGPDTTIQGDTDYDAAAQQGNEEETRARLFTLGVMILELMFGHPIEACQFRREYLGADGRPNDQTDISTARRWSRGVLGESGPDVSDVVRRCLDCSFGPQPSFADGRFREAVYAGVILPLTNYTKLWPEVMP